MNNNEDKPPLGTSTEAIVNSEFSVSVRKEKSIELLTNMITKVSNGDDVVPFVIACKNGKIIAEQCIVNPDGSIALPDIRVNTKQDINSKSKFVRKILKEISPVLKAEIENVTYVALMRKDADKLESMMLALRNKGKNTKVKIENRAGCIWLIVDEFQVVI